MSGLPKSYSAIAATLRVGLIPAFVAIADTVVKDMLGAPEVVSGAAQVMTVAALEASFHFAIRRLEKRDVRRKEDDLKASKAKLEALKCDANQKQLKEIEAKIGGIQAQLIELAAR